MYDINIQYNKTNSSLNTDVLRESTMISICFDFMLFLRSDDNFRMISLLNLVNKVSLLIH